MVTADPVEDLRAACRDGARRAHGDALRTRLTAVADRLDRPLRLAVAGAVGAGKSTLVNALLRRPVAPAEAGECTRWVTWFEFNARERVLVEGVDGTSRTLELVDGRVPVDLGMAPEAVLRLRVQLGDPWLRGVTIIDTPGLDTVSRERERAARELLFGERAAGSPRALLYLLRYVQRFDADTLEELRGLSGACGLSAEDTVAVLTQVDRRSDDEDPWLTARRLAARAEADLAGLVGGVVPVMGLLAETARSRRLTEPEVLELRALAAMDAEVVDDLLLDVDEFAEGEADVFTRGARRGLVARLHTYGIREATRYLRRRPGAGADGLHHWLAGRSGYGSDLAAGTPTATWQVTADDPELACTVAEAIERLAGRAARLKVAEAARSLSEIAVDPRDRALLARLRRTAGEVQLDAGVPPDPTGTAAPAAGPEVTGTAGTGGTGFGRLRDSPVVGERERAALVALAGASDLRSALPLPRGASHAERLATATDLAGRFRILLHRPLPAPEKQAAEAACDVFETIVHMLRAREQRT
jgi:Dynamin family